MKKQVKILLPFIIILIICNLTSCRKDRNIINLSAQPTFSEDTILFDTVFTTVGSVTKNFKIYNRSNGILRIDRLYLAGNAGQVYRLNVDGVPGRDFSGIEINGGDSLFVFVEVTLDPNGGNIPMLVTDDIIFIANNQTSKVALVAYGQDAYFHTPPSGSGSPFFTLPCNDFWANDKPHVIYGYAIVDSSCNLTIQEGAKIYAHPNSSLLVYNSGTLQAVGTPTNRIQFQGDRLEPDYDSLPGQWSGIILLEAGNSNIEFCDIRNSTVGVRVETVSGSISPLVMNYVRIENMSNFGVWNNVAGDISMTNCMINNCGQYDFVCTGGGFIKINHCTFADYWSYESRSTPVFGMGNYFTDNSGATVVVDLSAEINNTIIYGTEDNEMVIDMSSLAQGDYMFNTCFIRTDQAVTDPAHFVNISKNVFPNFVDATNQDYHLQSNSSCINAGNVVYRIDYDLEFYPRDANPDIGCFEFH